MPFELAPLFVDPVTAAAAVALIIAGVLLADMLGSLIGKINIGPIHLDPGSWFRSIAHTIENWAMSTFDHLIAPVGHWLNGIAYDAYHTLSDAVNAVSHLGDQIAHIVNTTIPDAIARQFANIMGIVDSDLGKVYGKIDSEVSTLEGKITDAAGATFAHLAGIIDSDIGAVHALIGKDVAAAEKIASDALATVERTLTGDISRAITTAEAAAAAAAAVPIRDLGAAVGAADTAIGALAGTLTGDIDSVNAQLLTIAAAAATALSVATTVAREFESCAVTSCDGPNNLGNLLNGLLGVISYAELASFVSLAIGKPGVAAGEFAGAAHGLYTDADQLLSTLLAI